VPGPVITPGLGATMRVTAAATSTARPGCRCSGHARPPDPPVPVTGPVTRATLPRAATLPRLGAGAGYVDVPMARRTAASTEGTRRSAAGRRTTQPDGPDGEGGTAETGASRLRWGATKGADKGGVAKGGVAKGGVAKGGVAGSAGAGASERLRRLSPGFFRERILPRSMLGVASLILAFAIGAGFSGVILFSYYQYKLNQTNDRVNSLIDNYKTAFTNAEGNLNADVANAKSQIQNQLKAFQQQQVGPTVLAGLIKQMAPSVLFVHTLDANGQPSVGTAFVVSSSGGQSLLVTSYTTVAAATHAPGPAVYVRQGNTDTQVTVRTWDPQYDLALLVYPKGGLKPITAAPSSPSPQPGDRLFAVSGLGSAGASIIQEQIADVSAAGVTVYGGVGQAFQGAPIITLQGQVLAVASRSYAPLGFASSSVFYAPYVEAACNKVLTCPGGSLVGSH
jgi:hypothetical protein